MEISVQLRNKLFEIALPLIIALAITFFLFYIDEGYYNFNWTQQPGAWFVFSIYVLFFLIGQGLVMYLFRKKTLKLKWWLTIGIGLPLGLLLALSFFLS